MSTCKTILPLSIQGQSAINTSATSSVIITNTIAGTVTNAQNWIYVYNGVGYTNSFVDFNTSTWQNTAYMKDARNIVTVVVAAKNGTAGTSIFTLPVGYRPATSIIFGAYRAGGAAEFIKVFADGTVVTISGLTTTGGILTTLSFPAAA